MSTNLTPEEFETMLAKHDWYYNFSDDHGVWTRGEAEIAKIHHILETRPDLQPSYQLWLSRVFSKANGF